MERPEGPLHTKYRPRTIDEIKGNQPAKDALADALSKTPIPKVYLITGPSGCGKTTIAYLIRDALGCHSSAFSEYDASSDRGIDDLRKIKNHAMLHPMMGDISVIFFDECHQITGPAQEAMLKMLEVPPPHVYFILATTEPTKLKETLRRRCHKIPLDIFTENETIKLLEDIVDEEDKRWMSPKVFKAIYKASFGSPGQAVQILDQIITLCPMEATAEVKREKKEEAIKIIEGVTFSQGFVLDLCKTMSNKNLSGYEKWQICSELLKTFKGNAESSRLAIMAYFETILLKTGHPWIARTMATFNEPMLYTGKSGLTLATFYACKDFMEDDERKKNK